MTGLVLGAAMTPWIGIFIGRQRIPCIGKMFILEEKRHVVIFCCVYYSQSTTSLMLKYTCSNFLENTTTSMQQSIAITGAQDKSAQTDTLKTHKGIGTIFQIPGIIMV